MIFVVIFCAVVIDWLAGEPRRLHPLVGFGWLANHIETLFNRANHRPISQFTLGLLALLICIVPFTLLTFLLSQISLWGTAFSVLMLYLCIGHRSLFDHARPIMHLMQNGNENEAKELASRIVSRDKAHLDVNKATIESVLENGNDAVFAAIFWFVIGGAAGVVAYRLVNTLDAMWGYRSSRFFYFGKAAARLDDLLNYLPARLTALSYALSGKTRCALSCWRRQAPLWDSPNAGPVMASGAGALDIQLGGPACYQGKWHQRPLLGTHAQPQAEDIQWALRLVSRSVLLWLITIGIVMAVLHA